MKKNMRTLLLILFIVLIGLGGGAAIYVNNASNSVTTFDISNLQNPMTEKDYSKIFKEAEGSFVIYDTNRDRYIVYNKDEALQQLAPGDTFGIFNTLVALEKGVVKDASGLKNIKDTAQAIGKEEMEKQIKAASYGNTNMSSGIERFWQKSLKISLVEQVELLRKIFAGDIKFSDASIDAVKKAMLIGDVRNGVLYGIYDKSSKGVITYVGSYEKRGNTYIYATRVKGGNLDEAMAKDIVGKVLNSYDLEIAKTKTNRMNVLYEVPNMDKVQVKKNITYKTYGNNQKLGMDLYSPLQTDNNKKPYAIIMIHGAAGVASIKDTGCYNSWGRIGAASGYATIVFNWRAWDRKSAAENSQDIADAITYIRAHAEELNINPDHMSIFAYSAGVKEGVRKALEVDTGFIDSIVEYYGELPLEVLEKADAKPLPPMFLADAAYDEVMNTDVNKEFFQKASALQYPITRMVHQQGGHAFELFDDNMSTYDIIKKSLEFVEANRKDK